MQELQMRSCENLGEMSPLTKRMCGCLCATNKTNNLLFFTLQILFFPFLLLRVLLLLLSPAFFLSHSEHWSCKCRSHCWVAPWVVGCKVLVMLESCTVMHTPTGFDSRAPALVVSALTAGQSRHCWCCWTVTKANVRKWAPHDSDWIFLHTSQFVSQSYLQYLKSSIKPCIFLRKSWF